MKGFRGWKCTEALELMGKVFACCAAGICFRKLVVSK